MDFKNLQEPKTIRGILIGIGVMLIVIVIFQAGVFVGFRKAAFSYQLGDNYYKTFRGSRPVDMIGVDGGNVPGGHGAVGKIVRIALPTIIIADEDNVEKIVLIGSSTMIKRFDQTISPEELQADDFVIIIGAPNKESIIHAKLIRLVPPASQN